MIFVQIKRTRRSDMPEKIIQRKCFVINTAYILIAAMLVLLTILTAGLLMPFWIALFLSAILQPITRLLSGKLGLKKKGLSTIVLFLFYLLLFCILIFGIAEVTNLFGDLFQSFPDYYKDTIVPALGSLGNSIEQIFSIIPNEFRPDMAGLQMSIMTWIEKIVSAISQYGLTFAGNVISGFTSSILSVLMTILLSYFITVQYDTVVAFLKCQLPDKIRTFGADIKPLLKNSVVKYLKATLILMFITFIELAIGLSIIKGSNPIGMALGIAIFDALPVFGTGGIMIPWIIIELLSGNYALAGGLLILYIIITIMRNILDPKILGSQLGINPIVVLLAVLIGGRLLGVLGMIFFPITAYVLTVLHDAGKIKLYKNPPKLNNQSRMHSR
ncbi:sporulation integral membrane protein YtvI [[Clostridium] symbiosum ATCC 14940]|uniref:Sporulation integral membrane protein YtvI n=3 Tax=Clostridium symbiosum TaxID=1512 RepID=A0ABC9TWV7_CLOSY|nr:sporulation integral membrane protein YtvI [[Clostridium] symbiosum ATCC 14940]